MASTKTISDLYTRLQTVLTTIRTKLVDFGLVESSDKFEAIATAISGIVNRGNVDASVQEGESYTIQPGYHKGGTVRGIAGGGNYSLQAKGDITPTKSDQPVAPDSGYYGISSLTIKAIPEAYQDVTAVTATSKHVLAGDIFVDATGAVKPGEMLDNGAVSKTLDASEGNQSYTPAEGYHNGNGKVQIVLEEKTGATGITPTKSTQTVKPSAGKVLSEVEVKPIPDAYQDVTGVTASASDVKASKKFVTPDGTLTPGAMTEITGSTTTLDATTGKQSHTIPEGYHDGTGKVQIVLEEKTGANAITPGKTAQTVTPAAGKVLSRVEVEAIPDNYIDTSGATVFTGTIDGINSTECEIPTGYHPAGSKVTLTDDIYNLFEALL